MAQTNNPMPDLPAPPPVSRRTIPIAGIVVDFYGIDELAADTASVSLLWLHHPRLRSRADMADMAARCVGAFNNTSNSHRKQHGLVAAAFDQRNHGSRLVAARANTAWREGNATHAQDMLGTMAGTVVDQQLLLDLVDSYIHKEGDEASSYDDDDHHQGSAFATGLLPPHVAITQHVQLGVSLGGHTGWQLLFGDPRITAAVLVIGCPDYMAMMADRARLSKLKTYTAATTDSAPFFGSPDFPPGLVDACRKYDPRGIVFGRDTPAWPQQAEAGSGSGSATGSTDHLHNTLQRLVGGKRVLVCSGGADKLVPYRCIEPFVSVLQQAAETWPDLALTVANKVYDGVGHAFSPAMVADAVQFVVETVAAGGAESKAKI